MYAWRSKGTSVFFVTKTANGGLCRVYYSDPEGRRALQGRTRACMIGDVKPASRRLAQKRRTRRALPCIPRRLYGPDYPDHCRAGTGRGSECWGRLAFEPYASSRAVPFWTWRGSSVGGRAHVLHAIAWKLANPDKARFQLLGHIDWRIGVPAQNGSPWFGICRLTGGQFPECAMGAWTLRPRTRMYAPCAPFISQTIPEAADERNLAAYDAGKS